jgi:UDP-glucose 4-epimerase
MTRRILITGGAGFIGSHIAEVLAESGNHVIVFDNLSTGSRANLPDSIKLVRGDVRCVDDLAPVFTDGVDVVLHIAGQASIRLSFQDPANDLNVNTLGTINVLQQCVQHHVPRLLFASSMTIYGHPETVPTPEDTPAVPVSNYGVTKYAAERYVHIMSTRRDLGFDFNVTSFRMFNVYGPRQSLTNAYQGVLAFFMGNVLRGEPITIHSDGEQFRDFVYISDVVRAWIKAIDQPATFGETINLGTGRPTSVNQVCDAVLQASGHARSTYPIQYGDAQPGDLRQSLADIRKAQSLLGWEPKVTFEEVIEQTFAWARDSQLF